MFAKIGTDFEVCGVLEPPIERDLTQEELAAYSSLHTNYPTTVITNDAGAHMEVSYVADTGTYIRNMESRLNAKLVNIQSALISQKISGGGIKVTDSSRVPVVRFAMWGKTEQVRTSGKNLLDGSKIVIGGLGGSNGIPFTTTNRMRVENIKVEQGKTYSIDLDKSKYGIANSHVFDAEGNRLSGCLLYTSLSTRDA